MNPKRVILANGSRLVREMFNRVLLKEEKLKVVQEVKDHENLPSDIDQTDTEWVIMLLPLDSSMPEWVDGYLTDHPFVHFLTVSTDGSQVRMRDVENREEELEDLSLKELLHILRLEPDRP